MRFAVAVRRIAQLRIRAEIHHEVDAQADQTAFRVEARLDGDALLPGLARGEEVLRAGLDPADGRVEHHRRGREHRVLARQAALCPNEPPMCAEETRTRSSGSRNTLASCALSWWGDW